MIEKIDAHYKALYHIHKSMGYRWDECKMYCMSGVADVVDSTAANAIDLVATHLLAELTPYSRPWFQIYHHNSRRPDIEQSINKILMRSNFFKIAHQAYLDLALYGTSNISVHEAIDRKIIQFHTTPINQMIYDIDQYGNLISNYRIRGIKDGMKIVECFIPIEHECYEHIIFAPTIHNKQLSVPVLLSRKKIAQNPFVNFRWKQYSGEIYGTSPIMQNISEIKTYNKIKKLMIENAALATTGIWHVDEDGVVDPKKIKMLPGALIPKSPNSKGITPIRTSNKFEVPESIVMDLHYKLEKSLTFSTLRPSQHNTTATEISRQINEKIEHMEALHCRLQNEFIIPLIYKTIYIMQKRGKIARNIHIDELEIEHISSARIEKRSKVIDNTLNMISKICAIDTEKSNIDINILLQWLADQNNLPHNIIKNKAVINKSTNKSTNKYNNE